MKTMVGATNSSNRIARNRWWLTAGLVAGYVAASNACGPFFSEAVFVKSTGPDGSYAQYVKGHIGVPQPGYRMRYLVVAYDWLNGHGLSQMEQQQAIALEAELTSPPPTYPARLTQAVSAPVQWADARAAVGVPLIDAEQADKQDKVPTAAERLAEVRMRNDTAEFAAERPVPGESYSYFTNCLADAYTTAVATMAARRSEHVSDVAGFTEWVHGQDAVFQNCNGQTDAMPAPVAASAPQWLREDRAYQRAAAAFYQMDYDDAMVRLRAIVSDRASPWNKTARLVIARAMIRRATVGQITEMDPAVRHAQAPGAQINATQMALMQAYDKTVADRRVARLREAEVSLQSIVDDPSVQQLHHSAAGLLDMVRLQIDPAAQALVLEQRLTDANRAQTPGSFRQALIDISYYPDGALPLPLERNGPGSPQPVRPDLLGFIRTMRQQNQPRRDFGYVNEQRVVPDARSLVQAKQSALNTWRDTHDAAWLLASLTAANYGDAEMPELLAAARSLPANSPGALAGAYYRLRFAGDTEQARGEMDRLLPAIERTESRSTVNLFRILKQHSAPSLAAFLDGAGLLPAAETDDADPESQPSAEVRDGLCHVRGSDLNTLLFDHDAATVLNTRMPLRMLADAAVHPGLAPNLRFQIAQATWTRAVLLGQPELAKQMGPILSGCYPAWKPVLAKLDEAGNATDREAEGLLALMRFASTEPVVREGLQRPEGFATYSEYRDNWWQGSRNAVATVTGDAPVHATFFGTQPAPETELPDPQWLTSADRATAAREIAELRTVACASDYFAAKALHWQEQHPEDARTPDILGFAERVVRSGCRTDATRELNHRLFIVVQTKYPKSEWAARYGSWE
jgi:hypothetical protein